MPKGYTDIETADRFDPVRFAKENFPGDPFKYLARYYDRRVVAKGGTSIFAYKYPHPVILVIDGERNAQPATEGPDR